MNTTVPGKGLLKITGIIGIIFGLINIIRFLLAFLIDLSWLMTGRGSFTLLLYFLFALVVICYGIYVSALGVQHCKNLEKAEHLEKLGIIHVLLILAIAILSAALFGNIWAIHPMILIIELLLPILYIAGASKNIKAAKAASTMILVRAAPIPIETWKCTNCNRNNPVSANNCVFCNTPKIAEN